MALMIHLVPIVVWKGQSETAAALLIAIFGGVSIVCRGSMGWICERFSKKKLASLTMLMGAMAVLVLMASSGALWQLAIYQLFLAMSDSGNVAAWSFFSEQFDRRAFATLFGITTFVYRLLSAGTPILAAYIFDSSGSYFWALMLMLALYISSGLIFWNIPRLKVGLGSRMG